MKLEKARSSSNKAHKVLRNLGIAAALFGVMNTTQSCKDKNAGMPVHADTIEFAQEESTDTTNEYIKIDDNKVKFSYNFDFDGNHDWNKKNIKYDLEVNRSKDNKITATLKGSTYYGPESDRGAVPENENSFRQEFEYSSLEDYNQRFPNEVTRYIGTVMDNFQNNNMYTASGEDININDDANNEVGQKTSQLTGYLKYKMNTHELSVRKQGDEVVLPIKRNDHTYQFNIQENKTDIKVQDKAKNNAKLYDITLNGKITTVALSENDVQFAEELTKEVEKLLAVGDIPQTIEDAAFLGKGLEVKQLLDK